MDVAKQLRERLISAGIECSQDWEWSAIPSVTATAKPAASPIAGAVQGGEAGDEFATRLVSTGQLADARSIRKRSGSSRMAGAPIQMGQGSRLARPGLKPVRSTNVATTKAGSWLAASSQKFAISLSRIECAAESRLDRDNCRNGPWLVADAGRPAESRVEVVSRRESLGALRSLEARGKGGCPDLQVALESRRFYRQLRRVPAAIRASMEYSHGGVSLQEMVTPVLRVTTAKAAERPRSAGGSQVDRGKMSSIRRWRV